jgi:hypothetical protein
MSDTQQLLALAAVWTVIAFFISRLVANWPGRIALFVALVGIPFWELPFGYLNLRRLCEAEGKLRAAERIVPQRSVCFTYPIETSAGSLLDRGFAFVEERRPDGHVVAYSRLSPNSVASAGKQEISSSYCVGYVNNNHLPWRILRHDFLVSRAKDGVIVARISDFDWLGMWWQDLASPILGRGGRCESGQVQPILLLLLKGS